jgi:hypothetical protein
MELLKKDGAAPIVDPRRFDGQFFFTNPDTEDFTAFWNGTPYTFPAMKTSPLVIMDATPIETQEIRKRFAFKLAERMFGKSKKYKALVKESAGKASPLHYDQKAEYEPLIEMCLKPLPVGATKAGKKTKRDIELHDGIRVYNDKDAGKISLVKEAEDAQ